jgi:hypothetical protein
MVSRVENAVMSARYRNGFYQSGSKTYDVIPKNLWGHDLRKARTIKTLTHTQKRSRRARLVSAIRGDIFSQSFIRQLWLLPTSADLWHSYVSMQSGERFGSKCWWQSNRIMSPEPKLTALHPNYFDRCFDNNINNNIIWQRSRIMSFLILVWLLRYRNILYSKITHFSHCWHIFFLKER